MMVREASFHTDFYSHTDLSLRRRLREKYTFPTIEKQELQSINKVAILYVIVSIFQYP
jgi:hypothetical protein